MYNIYIELEFGGKVMNWGNKNCYLVESLKELKVMQNREGNINSFFRINNIIADEFYYLDNMNGPLNKLANSLKELKSFAETEFVISIVVNACINNKHQWLKEVCEEIMLKKGVGIEMHKISSRVWV